MDKSQIKTISDRIAAEIRAAAEKGGVGRVQSGRVWAAAGRVRVYVTQGAKEIGYMTIDDDGAIDCGELRMADRIAPHLEPVAAELGVQVYGY